ncbi:MAG TPA: GFA family protein [Pseudolabrys sp.]|nr:GFA family protein [Pseudolabrys sp.]
MKQTYLGGCQCGKVRYEVALDLDQPVIACNCSRCGRLGSLLAFAPAEEFKLTAGEGATTEFQFNKHVIHHRFCSTCGIQSFAIGKNPKTGTQMAAINARSLDGVDVERLMVKKVDGRSF